MIGTPSTRREAPVALSEDARREAQLRPIPGQLQFSLRIDGPGEVEAWLRYMIDRDGLGPEGAR